MSYVGVVDILSEASKLHIIIKDGMMIGVYACTEYEFSIATEKSAGVNPFEQLESLDHIQELKEKRNYIIV